VKKTKVGALIKNIDQRFPNCR